MLCAGQEPPVCRDRAKAPLEARSLRQVWLERCTGSARTGSACTAAALGLLAMLASEATLVHPHSSATVHVVGVSHQSAQSTRRVWHAIAAAQPSVVVLEAHEVRSLGTETRRRGHDWRSACAATVIRPPPLTPRALAEARSEAGARARRWLVENNKHDLVGHTTARFLDSPLVWRSLSRGDTARAAYALTNEGGALLEGFVYRAEVIVA